VKHQPIDLHTRPHVNLTDAELWARINQGFMVEPGIETEAMRAATTLKDYRRPNMTTDEMILELVETGKFTLPPDVVKAFYPVDKCECFALEMKDVRTGEKAHVFLSNQQAHAICAMHFAREMKSWTDKERAPVFHTGFTLHMHDGDSAAAIGALYEAVCGTQENK
jgi:hypothetical protein